MPALAAPPPYTPIPRPLADRERLRAFSAALITQALADLDAWHRVKDRPVPPSMRYERIAQRRAAQDAVAWLRGERNAVLSFAVVADTLDVDPGVAAEKILDRYGFAS